MLFVILNKTRRQGDQETGSQITLLVSPSPCLLVLLLNQPQLRSLKLRISSGVDITDHMQVVMVDVDDFFCFFVA
jgi:hypothetical protein